MVGIWPLTASKPPKCNFFKIFGNFNFTNGFYIASGPQKGILLRGFIRGQIDLQWSNGGHEFSSNKPIYDIPF